MIATLHPVQSRSTLLLTHSMSLTQAEQRQLSSNQPGFDAFRNTPSRHARHSASITPMPVAAVKRPGQPDGPSQSMSVILQKHHTSPSLPESRVSASRHVSPAPMVSPSFSRESEPPSPNDPPITSGNQDKKSPKRPYFDYGLSTTTADSSLPRNATTVDVPENSSPFSSPLYAQFTNLLSLNACSFPSELPSPSHARTPASHIISEKDVPITITTSPPKPFFHSQPFWLVLYFCFNLGLTLYNKGVLIHFPFAYTLTAIHALFGTVGGIFLLKTGIYTPAKLSNADNMALVAFSVLYSTNIAVSNLSLEMVTLPFHQVVRAATPIFTIFLSMVLFGSRSSGQKVASLVPVVVGVGLATYGDYYCTAAGLILTVLGTFLAAMKTIFTSILQSPPSLSHQHHSNSLLRCIVPPRLQLHPLDLLTRMAPLAFVECVILAHISGELDRVRLWSAHEMTPWTATVLSLNGAIAFGLNIVSFTANKKAGPLSMTVAANVKQVLSIILAVLIFDLSISFTNAAGIMLTLAGGAWYAAVEYRERRARGKI